MSYQVLISSQGGDSDFEARLLKDLWTFDPWYKKKKTGICEHILNHHSLLSHSSHTEPLPLAVPGFGKRVPTVQNALSSFPTVWQPQTFQAPASGVIRSPSVELLTHFVSHHLGKAACSVSVTIGSSETSLQGLWTLTMLLCGDIPSPAVSCLCPFLAQVPKANYTCA